MRATRAVPMMNVEVDGVVVSRPGVLRVLMCDVTGKPKVACMKPQLWPGEELVERVGRIPAIVRKTPCAT